VSAKTDRKSTKNQACCGAKTKKRNDKPEEKPMSSLRNFAVQAAATLTLSAALAALLYNVADLATRGVVVA
jgi:hypothetical protein